MRAPSAFRYPALINGSVLLTAQPCGLRSKMASHAPVDPALELVGQIKDFDRHGGSPLHVRGSRLIGQRAKGRLIDSVTGNIDDLTDRFQYLSVNSS
jgi:hypothetical protein